jgi:RHS repeat-associated protein
MSIIITTLAARGRRRAGRSAPRRWLGAGLAVALVAAGVQAVSARPALAAVPAAGGAASKGSAPTPVSNAFAMGGGVGGSIDQRTGAFQATVPLVNVTGRAGTGLGLGLSYEQSLAVLGTNRFGLGAGWTLGVPWVDTAGGVHVYPASGGSYAFDAGSPTGLAEYPLRDLTFARDPGTTTARPGAAAQPYVYTLTYLDGTVDRFDANGNLIERADRFGNPIDLTWQQSGQRWLLTSVTDNYGQVTRFDYGTANQVTITAPVNAEGIAATTTLAFGAGFLQTVTDPLGQKTSLGYSPVSGLPARLLSSVTSPTGEHTSVTYTQLPYEQGVVEASDVKVTDAAGVQVLAERHFTLNPTDDVNQHNYTGYPLYNSKGTNGLFDSGNFGYQYTTELSDSTSAVESTYNSLHLLMTQKVLTAAPGGGFRTSQTQVYKYPAVNSVGSLPPDYAKPTSVTVTYGDPEFKPNRTVTTSSAYNDQGEQTSFTNAAGTTTATTYNTYGLPATQTVTGPHGATSITTDTFTTDGKAVETATTAVGPTAKAATARTIATYSYNDSGQVTGESLAWAPGAKPAGDSGGPDQFDTTQQISTDTAAHTQTDVVTTAAGTPQATSATTVTDLVTGQVVSKTSPGNLTTSYTYDALGRQLTMATPGGQITKTVYDSPTQTTVTAPSGLVTQTTTDVLGRTMKVTDNVSGEQLVANPAARTVQTDKYSPDGSQLTTTTPAGTTTTTFDPLGRPVQIVQPDGITQAEQYNDVANTQAVSVLPAAPAGANTSNPVSVTMNGFNDRNQPVSSSVSYPDGTPQAPAAETYDGLGRVTSYTADDVTADPDYGGAGGLQTGTTLTPGAQGSYPGQPSQSATGNTMTGALTTKTLAGQAKTAKRRVKATPPAPGTTYSYDAAGRVHTAVTADGAKTTYTYTPAGQIATVTQPSGTKTTYTYDAKTGRLTEVDVHSADGRTQQTGYTYYPDTGRVKSVDDPAHPDDAISYDYDADGHLIAKHYPDGTSTAASYDDNGRLATITDVTGAVTTYSYNPNAGEAGGCGPAVTDLCRAVQVRGSAGLASVTYTYDSMDRVHTITRGNGVTTTLAYTDASQVKTETTTAADGTLLRTDSYTYDSHGNVATHTIASTLPAPAPPGAAARAAGHGKGATRHRKGASPATTTAAYGYDAYNRLISAKVYPGATVTGTPASTTSYTLDAAGNVTGQDTTTSAGATHVVNTITPGGELTGRTVNGAAASQKFDADGNVTTDLANNTYTYDPDGEQASVTTPAGTTTSYTYWPDHTRRTATTTVNGVTHVITYHYAINGKIANDTYTGAAAGATGPDTITASYLLAVNREARTLATSTNGGPVTAQTTGPGTGYYLTDAHGSVTAMIDNSGQVTASYAYDDYGQPIGASPALLPTPAAAPAGNAAVSPFGYDDAYTNPSTGTQYLPARSYDPAQGRFLSADAADQFNRYQAFDANPIVNTDPTGQWSFPQILTDAFTAALFIAFGVLSAGAAVPVLAAAAAGEVIETAALASAVLNTVAAATNIAAGATSATLTADDAAELTGNGFLSDSEKEDLNTATFALGTIAGVAGVGASAADSFKAEESAVEAAATTDQPAQAAASAGTAAGPAPEPQLDLEGTFGIEGLEDWLNYNTDVYPSTAGADSSLAESSAGDFSDEAGGISQVPDTTNSPGLLGGGQTTPQTLDEATAGFTAGHQQTGYDQNLRPALEPFSQAENLPGGPADTSTDVVPTSQTPTGDTATSATTSNPLTDATSTGIQNTLDGNTSEATPEVPDNLLGENLAAPVTGAATDGGLLGGSGLTEDSELPGFETVLTFGF